jgi:hypothetical protein
MEERIAAQAVVEALADLIAVMPDRENRSYYERLLGLVRRDYGIAGELRPRLELVACGTVVQLRTSAQEGE